MAAESSRVACVDIPALALQILLHDHPKWQTYPVAVVEEDKPQAKLLWVNEHARRLRVLPGMRFAAARSLASKLRASVVPTTRIEQVVGELFATLHRYSPRVEPSPVQPGVFFLDPGGLYRLYGSFEQWCAAIHHELHARGFSSSVLVGFHRYRCYAIARSHRGAWVLPSPAHEAKIAASVPLDRLEVSATLRDQLALLDVRTLGALMALPESELRLRFGEEAAALYQRASDDAFAPLRARKLIDPIEEVLQLGYPERDDARLLFRIKPVLERLLEQLVTRHQAMSALRVVLHLDHAGAHPEQIEPATPTLDPMQVLDLLRLRLGALNLPAGVEEVHLSIEGQAADVRQLALFRAHHRRDLEAGARALARVKASFGARAVTRARLRNAHLPEASFGWEPVTSLHFPDRVRPESKDPEGSRDPPPLMRRLLHRPVRISGPAPVLQDGWQLGTHMGGSVVDLHGPFRVSGGWWVRTVERDYYYARTQRGDVYWVYYDRPRRTWMLHGVVD